MNLIFALVLLGFVVPAPTPALPSEPVRPVSPAAGFWDLIGLGDRTNTVSAAGRESRINSGSLAGLPPSGGRARESAALQGPKSFGKGAVLQSNATAPSDTSMNSSGRAVGRKSQVRFAPLRADEARGSHLVPGGPGRSRRTETMHKIRNLRWATAHRRKWPRNDA